jgi:hypothetical protein
MHAAIASIEHSLQTENWYAALAVALTIPDVCASLESPDEESDGARYAAWFKTYLGDKYLLSAFNRRLDPTLPDFLTGAECYALRCAVLHEASDDLTPQRAAKVLEHIRLHAVMPHNMRITQSFGAPEMVIISVTHFCKDMCAAARAWLDIVANDEAIQRRLAATVEIHLGTYVTAGEIARRGQVPKRKKRDKRASRAK